MYSEKYPLGETGGLILVKNFITEDEENMLLESVNKSKWDKRLRRWTQHYGYKYNYRSRSITEDDYLGELPTWTNFVTDCIHKSKYVCDSGKHIDQVIINRYLPGEGINPHIDLPSIFGPTIYSLTLGSPCVMEFTRNNKKVLCYLKRRSLLVMSGDARYKWKHAIPSRTYDLVNHKKRQRGTRVSLTMRSMILEDENDN